MGIISKRLQRDVCVYWPMIGHDEFGKPLYGSPEEIDCRWEEDARMYLTSGGEQAVSQAVIGVENALTPRGLLWHGALVDLVSSVARENGDVFEIKKQIAIPNLKNTETFREVYV